MERNGVAVLLRFPLLLRLAPYEILIRQTYLSVTGSGLEALTHLHQRPRNSSGGRILHLGII